MIAKNQYEIRYIYHNENVHISLLEASIIISTIFLVATFEDIQLSLQTLLRGQNERLHPPGNLYFKHCLLVRKRVFGSQSNQ